jgi:hypothetical protein
MAKTRKRKISKVKANASNRRKNEKRIQHNTEILKSYKK